MSIRLRLAALFTLAALVLLGVGGYVYIRQLRAGLQDSLDQSLQARASTIAAALRADPATPLPSGDTGYAQVFARDGRLLHSSAALVGDRLITNAQLHAVTRGHPVQADRTVSLDTEDDAGPEAMRVYAAPGPGGTVVAVTASRDLVDEAVQQATWQLVIFGAIVLVLTGPGSWLLARAALRPVERMRTQVARLPADGADPAALPLPRRRDEIARLGATFNALLARLHRALERERSFVADAGHELRTPLTVLKGEFELAQRPGRTREDLLETVGIAADETDRLIRLTENLLTLAREGRPTPQAPLDLADLARSAATAAGPAAGRRGVTVQVLDEASGVVHGDAEQLRQAIDNLLTNALRHSPAGGTVTIRLTRDTAAARIEVADAGPGFPPTFLLVAFDRFTRADDARSRTDGGNGLGLAIVAAIMTAHRGTAVAANRPDGGAMVMLSWPQREPPAEAAVEAHMTVTRTRT